MPYRELTSLIKSSRGVVGAKVLNKMRDRTEEIYADVIVNAAGPWAGRIAQMAGADVEIMPTAGVMGVTQFQLVNHILNRMRPPSDGDIIIPYSQNVSITGTTVSIVEDPDSFVASEDDLQLLLDEGSAMVPKLRELGFSRYYASIRPLLRLRGEGDWYGVPAGLKDVAEVYTVGDEFENKVVYYDTLGNAVEVKGHDQFSEMVRQMSLYPMVVVFHRFALLSLPVNTTVGRFLEYL